MSAVSQCTYRPADRVTPGHARSRPRRCRVPSRPESSLDQFPGQGRRAAADVDHAVGGGNPGRVEHPQGHLRGILEPAAPGVTLGVGLIPAGSPSRLRCHLAMMPGRSGQANRLHRQIGRSSNPWLTGRPREARRSSSRRNAGLAAAVAFGPRPAAESARPRAGDRVRAVRGLRPDALGGGYTATGRYRGSGGADFRRSGSRTTCRVASRRHHRLYLAASRGRPGPCAGPGRGGPGAGRRPGRGGMGPRALRRGDRGVVLRPAACARRRAGLAERSLRAVAGFGTVLGRVLPVVGGRRRAAFGRGHPARAAGQVRDPRAQLRRLLLPRPERHQRGRRARRDRRRADPGQPDPVHGSRRESRT